MHFILWFLGITLPGRYATWLAIRSALHPEASGFRSSSLRSSPFRSADADKFHSFHVKMKCPQLREKAFLISWIFFYDSEGNGPKAIFIKITAGVYLFTTSHQIPISHKDSTYRSPNCRFSRSISVSPSESGVVLPGDLTPGPLSAYSSWSLPLSVRLPVMDILGSGTS